MNELLISVKQNNEDFEWYPTKEEMLIPIYHDIIFNRSKIDSFSILDIGAGDGRVFSILENINKNTPLSEQWNIKSIQESFNIKKYAIEKSKTLLAAMNKDVIIVGTDFTQQSLIDKKMDYIFCNPPYLDYVDWTCKILKEASCEIIYMIIPKRWKENNIITTVIDKRKIKTTILGNYDFLHAERKARAVVDVVKFELGYYRNSSFDIWFDEHFKINASQSNISDYYKNESKKENLNQLVDTNNFIFSIVELYNIDLQKLLSNYKAVESLDSSILNALGVNIEDLNEGLK